MIRKTSIISLFTACIGLGSLMLFQNCAPPLQASNTQSRAESTDGSYEGFTDNNYAGLSEGSSSSGGRISGSAPGSLAGDGADGGSGSSSVSTRPGSTNDGTTGSAGSGGGSLNTRFEVCYAGEYGFSTAEVTANSQPEDALIYPRYNPFGGRAANLQIFYSNAQRSIGQRITINCSVFVGSRAGGRSAFPDLRNLCNAASGKVTYECAGVEYEYVSDDCVCTGEQQPAEHGGHDGAE